MSKIKLKELIIVGSELKSSRIKDRIQRIVGDKSIRSRVVTVNVKADNSLTKSGILHMQDREFFEENREIIEHEVNSWVKNWVLNPKFNGISIYHNFTLEKKSFWWLIDRRIKLAILEVCLLIKKLQGIEKCTKTQKIIVYDEENQLQSLVPQVFDQKTTKIEIIGPRLQKKVRISFQKAIRKYGGIRLLFLREKSLEILGRTIFARYSHKKPIDEPSIAMLTGSSAWRSCYNAVTNKFEPGNYYFQDINNELEKAFEGKIVELFKIRNFRHDLGVVKEKHRKSPEGVLIFIDTCMVPEVKEILHKEEQFFKDKFRVFQQELLKEEDLEFSQVNFSSILKERIIWIFKANFSLGLRWKALFSGFISKIHPKAILLIDEFFTLGRSLIFSVMEHDSIISVAIQHGFFTEFGVGFAKPKKGLNNLVSSIHPLLPPDITAVYGPYYKQLLLEVGYPKEKILISGNPIYDQLNRLMRNISRESIIEKFNLDSDKKIIVFGTQPDEFFEEAITPLQTLVDLGKNYPHFQIIIKVHPRDDASRYQRFTYDNSIPVRIVKDINIFTIIGVSDLYITQFSTTILDALALNKAVAIFNFSKKNKLPSYMQTKAIIELTTPQEIRECIPILLTNNDIQLELISHRHEYLHNQLYKMDCNASKRIVQSITNRINQ